MNPGPFQQWTKMLAARDTAEGMGWHTQIEDDCLSLHRVRKNGTPLIGEDVSITYTEWEDDGYYADADEYIERWVKRVRPYSVRGKGHITKSFSSPNPAIRYFLELATVVPQ